MNREPCLGTLMSFERRSPGESSLQNCEKLTRLSYILGAPVYLCHYRGEFRPLERLRKVRTGAEPKAITDREIVHRVEISILSGTFKPAKSFIPILRDAPAMIIVSA